MTTPITPQVLNVDATKQAPFFTIEDIENEMMKLTLHSGSQISSENISVNIDKLNKSHPVSGSFLGILLRNAKSTLLLSSNGLKEAGDLWVKSVSNTDPNFIIFSFMAATFGIALFGGSLLFSAAIKASLWIPVIGVSALGGLAGGMIGLLTGDKNTANLGFKIGSGVLGNTAAMPALLVSAITVIPRGVAHLVGFFGQELLKFTALGRNHNQRNIVLETSLYQVTQDAYNLWTLGDVNIDYVLCDSSGSPSSIRNKQLETFREVMTLLKAGADVYDEHLSGRLSFSSYFHETIQQKIYKS